MPKREDWDWSSWKQKKAGFSVRIVVMTLSIMILSINPGDA